MSGCQAYPHFIEKYLLVDSYMDADRKMDSATKHKGVTDTLHTGKHVRSLVLKTLVVQEIPCNIQMA